MTTLQEKCFWSEGEYSHKGQWGNYRALLLMANAIKYGFAQNLLAKPGQTINVRDAERRTAKVECGWAREQDNRDSCRSFSPAPRFTEQPMNFQCFLHTILTDTPRPQAPEIQSWGATF